MGEILSGQILFSGETPDEVMTKHVLEGPEFGTLWPPPDLPDGVSAFIQRCLSKNPADRPADAAAFERELREFTTNIALPTKEAPAAFHSAVTASMPAADLSPAKAANQRQSAPPSDPPIHAPAPTVQYQPSAATLHPPLKKEQPGPKKSRLPGRIWPMLAMLGIGLVVGILMLIRALSNNPPEPDPVGAVSDAPTSAAVLQPGQAPSAASPAETAAALVNCTQAGQTRTSTQDGMTQVCVPAGEFEMGSDPRIDPYAQMDERPQHQVYLDSYWIDQTEVSNAAYARCVADGECTAPYKNSFILQSSYFEDSQFANYPVIFVNWNQAKEFCQWAGRRLPTEAEWEKAAREYSPRIYPWGNFPPNINLSNYNGVVGDTLPVDSFPQGASPYGVLNMAGNVWEWVSDWYAEGYYQNSPTRNPTGPQIGENRVLRGGAWNDESTSIRAANRNQYSPDGRNKSIGFRCAQSANTP
ncbi:SUMF1/EgtB/PvdO family nonheme iron enzyme [Levilinea saccharolytica]|uniref:SUMF1/EgtB/PvdO family nonheme iron enzyme n=1 Tax=Levilinea saccharolytica TaxID=229921 RepID=UPI001374A4A5|nr:SUMF1/EgtB/PvdO family nonheme iron enzyme [Levilinea saccharolytica]